MWVEVVGDAFLDSSLQPPHQHHLESKASQGCRQRTQGSHSGSSELFFHVISIHCKQLITRDEFPETNKFFSLSASGMRGVATWLPLAGSGSCRASERASRARLADELTLALGSARANSSPHSTAQRLSLQVQLYLNDISVLPACLSAWRFQFLKHTCTGSTPGSIFRILRHPSCVADKENQRGHLFCVQIYPQPLVLSCTELVFQFFLFQNVFGI